MPSLSTCPACGGIMAVEAPACPHCGWALPPPREPAWWTQPQAQAPVAPVQHVIVEQKQRVGLCGGCLLVAVVLLVGLLLMVAMR